MGGRPRRKLGPGSLLLVAFSTLLLVLPGATGQDAASATSSSEDSAAAETSGATVVDSEVSGRLISSVVMVISLFAAFAAGLYCSLRQNWQSIGLGPLGAVTGSMRTDMKLQSSLSVLTEPPSVNLSPTMVYEYVLNQEDPKPGHDGPNLSQHSAEQESFSKYARTSQYGAVPRPPSFELVSIDGHSGSILPPSTMMMTSGSSTMPMSIPKSNVAGHQIDERVHLAAGILDWA